MDDHFSSFHFLMDESFDVRSFARPRDTSPTRPPPVPRFFPVSTSHPDLDWSGQTLLPPPSLGHTTFEYLPSLRASSPWPATNLAAVAAARARSEFPMRGLRLVCPGWAVSQEI